MSMQASAVPEGEIPVVAIDGPAASGKGTVAARVATALGFAYLDSGALYRLVALKAARSAVSVDDVPALAAIALRLDVRFEAGTVSLDGAAVTDAIRAERVSSFTTRR